MKILVIGERFQFVECSEKLGAHQYTHVTSHEDAEKSLPAADLVFDFLISDRPESFSIYAGKPVTVFLNTWRISLAGLSHSFKTWDCQMFGFNGLPTLFNREYLEVTARTAGDAAILKQVCAQLKTEFIQVEDRVGMVTPRVICMIINEAYYTVQEGTASRADIDLAMKLGTNYPYGPFEWCEKLGLTNVYRLLDAVYEDTKDERYKISALMKKEFLGRLNLIE